MVLQNLSKNDLNKPGVYTLIEPTQASSRVIKTVLDYADAPHTLKEAVGAGAEGSELPVHNGLWMASLMLTKSAADKLKSKADAKKVFLWTNDDNPNESAAAAVKRASDCHFQREQLMLWPMQRIGARPFDVENSWWWPVLNASALGDKRDGSGSSSAAAAGDDGDDDDDSGDRPAAEYVNPTESIFDLPTIRQRVARKRTYARVIFTLADGVHLALGVYNTVYPAKKPAPKSIQASTQYALNVRSRYVEKATSTEVEDHQMIKTYTLGGETLVFSDAEAKDMKRVMGAAVALPPSSSASSAGAAAALSAAGAGTEVPSGYSSFSFAPSSSSSSSSSVLGAAGAGSSSSAVAVAPPPEAETKGLRLMGFKPRSVISPLLNLRPPIFLYPSEREVNGGTQVLRALWQRMLERDVVAICRFNAREASAPRFVALWADRQRTKEDGSGVICPAGVYAITLPYADDIRNVSVDSAPVAAEASLVDKARDVIRSLPMPNTEDGKSYDAWQPGTNNPVLQKFWSGLETMALNVNPRWDEATGDDSAPDVERMEERAHAQLQAFRDAAGLSASGSSSSSKARSGGAAGGAAGAQRGRGSVEGEVLQAEGIAWDAEVAADSLATHTVPVLKDACKRFGLPVSGTKGVLMERIKEHFQSGGAPAAGKKARK